MKEASYSLDYCRNNLASLGFSLPINVYIDVLFFIYKWQIEIKQETRNYC